MGGEHVCTQVNEITAIKQMIEDVQAENKLHDIDREKRLVARTITDKALTDALAELSGQMKDLIELNNEVKDLKTAWRIGKTLGLGLAAIVAGLGIIFGGIFAVKEWFKH